MKIRRKWKFFPRRVTIGRGFFNCRRVLDGGKKDQFWLNPWGSCWSNETPIKFISFVTMCYDIVDDNITDTNNTIFDWNELIPTVVVSSVTFVLGLVGNCLIIFTTFQYRRMQSVTNVFLSSLASADLVLIMICIPVKVGLHLFRT